MTFSGQPGATEFRTRKILFGCKCYAAFKSFARLVIERLPSSKFNRLEMHAPT